jgi:hypothetical protein
VRDATRPTRGCVGCHCSRRRTQSFTARIRPCRAVVRVSHFPLRFDQRSRATLTRGAQTHAVLSEAFIDFSSGFVEEVDLSLPLENPEAHALWRKLKKSRKEERELSEARAVRRVSRPVAGLIGCSLSAKAGRGALKAMFNANGMCGVAGAGVVFTGLSSRRCTARTQRSASSRATRTRSRM